MYLLIFTSTVFVWWILSIAIIVTFKFELFKRTWNEAYIRQTAVLIESDDWGPGDVIHAARLKHLLDAFSNIRDSVNRSAVLSADVVLSVPDAKAIANNDFSCYVRKFLADSFPEMLITLLSGIRGGTLVPQLHGLEHLHGDGLMMLGKRNDPRVKDVFANPDWCAWENLDSPLQAHYLDGSALPTRALDQETMNDLVKLATTTFSKTFGFPSISTVAPCYLWGDEVESAWKAHNIEYIQTAGYRCTLRDKNGKYIQDPVIIRPGDRNQQGQIYLVRNVMFEPVDGKNTVKTAYQEVKIAKRQCLPVVISTHRYNYTGKQSDFERSLHGLETLLCRIRNQLPEVRFLSSPELGNWYAGKENPLTHPLRKKTWPSLASISGAVKFKGFLYRLWYRHPKLRFFSFITALFIPGGLIVLFLELKGKGPWRLRSAR